MSKGLLDLMLLAAIATAAAPAAVAAPDLILRNGKVITVAASDHQALAISDGKIAAVGSDAEISRLAGTGTAVVDLGGRTVIPGLIDSHIHAIRAGAEYLDTIDLGDAASLADVTRLLRAAAAAAPKGSWLIVRGGWHRNQLAERRVPTPAELDAAAPDNPAFVLHQYDTIVLNQAGVAALGVSGPDSLPAPLQAELDAKGAPTGVVKVMGGSVQVSEILARISRPTPKDKVEGTARYFRALNGAGLTGFTDAGGVEGSSRYQPVFILWREGRLTLRVRYNIQSVTPGRELAEVQAATQLTPPGFGDDWLSALGLGEYMTKGMFDTSPLKGAPKTPEAIKEALVYATWAAQNGYSLEVHVTHDATAAAFLDIYEEVNRTTPIAPLRWKFAHCEDCSDLTLKRMASLGMALAAQDRLYFDAAPYIAARGLEAVRRAPPVMTAQRLGVKVGAGTDATVPTPWNPFVALQWLVSGRSATGQETRAASELPSRLEALRMYTLDNAWMSFEEDERGSIEPGKFADLVILDRDYMTVPENEIGRIRPLATIVGGKVVFSTGVLRALPAPDATPSRR